MVSLEKCSWKDFIEIVKCVKVLGKLAVNFCDFVEVLFVWGCGWCCELCYVVFLCGFLGFLLFLMFVCSSFSLFCRVIKELTLEAWGFFISLVGVLGYGC